MNFDIKKELAASAILKAYKANNRYSAYFISTSFVSDELSYAEKAYTDFNILLEEIDCFYYNTNKKNGTAARSWCRYLKHRNPVTWLNKCQLCGKTSTPKKVNERDVYGWDIGRKQRKRLRAEIKMWESKTMLCMGCWNKVKPIHHKFLEAEKTRLLINRANRERLKWRKLQMQDN